MHTVISIHPASLKAEEGRTFSRGFETVECDLGELCWLALAYQWSPVIWRDGRRLQTNFVSSDYLALDFDSPEYPLAAALRGFAGLCHFIGTTRSHQKEKGGFICDRYRVVIPWSERITSLEHYRHNVKIALRMYDHADSACQDGARLFFPCRSIVSLELDGDVWDVETLPVASERKPSTRRTARGYVTAAIRSQLETPIPKGQRHPSFFKLGAALRRSGFGPEEAVGLFEGSATMREAQIVGALRDRSIRTFLDGYERQKREDEEAEAAENENETPSLP